MRLKVVGMKNLPSKNREIGGSDCITIWYNGTKNCFLGGHVTSARLNGRKGYYKLNG